MNDAAAGRPTRVRAVGAWLLPAVLALGCYANTLGNGPVIDDATVLRDPSLGSLRNVGLWFSSPYWREPGTALRATARPLLYRPLATLTFALDRAVSGEHLSGFHLTNACLHAAATLALFSLLQFLLGAGIVAWLAAALFAVHPVHTEAVAGLANRSEVLATMFGLLALATYASAALPRGVLRSPDEPGAASRPVGTWSRVARFALALLLLAAALLSKESAITVPILLAGLEVAGLLRASGSGGTGGCVEAVGFGRRVRGAVLRLAFVAVVSALYLGLRSWALHDLGVGSGGGIFENRAVPLASRVATMLCVFADYVRLLVWPHPLCADYPENAEQAALLRGLLSPEVMLSAAVVASALVSSLLALRRRPDLSFFGLWFFITLLPVSNLLLPIAVVKAERLLYLASAGACVLLATVLAAGMRARGPTDGRPRAVKCAAAGLVVLFAALTVRRNTEWSDEVTLFTPLVARRPTNQRVAHWMGTALALRGDTDGAIREFTRAAELAPGWLEPVLQRGLAWAARGEHALALADLDLALPIADRFPVQMYRGLSLRALGHFADAREAFRLAYSTRPYDAAILRELALEFARARMDRDAGRLLYRAFEAEEGRRASASRVDFELGRAFVSVERPADGLLRLEASEAADAITGGGRDRDAPHWLARGEALLALGSAAEAEACFDAALRTSSSASGAASGATSGVHAASALAGRGRARLSRGENLEAALTDLRAAADAAAAGPAGPAGADLDQDVAIALVRLGRAAEAGELLARLRSAGVPPRADLVRALRAGPDRRK
ncbi:MAG: hypothetical protein HYZ53_02310 [Planctomycetes bacterium]|nr:hypothetical protein [Planctomycetota bacterium]